MLYMVLLKPMRLLKQISTVNQYCELISLIKQSKRTSSQKSDLPTLGIRIQSTFFRPTPSRPALRPKSNTSQLYSIRKTLQAKNLRMTYYFRRVSTTAQVLKRHNPSFLLLLIKTEATMWAGLTGADKNTPFITF